MIVNEHKTVYFFSSLSLSSPSSFTFFNIKSIESKLRRQVHIDYTITEGSVSRDERWRTKQKKRTIGLEQEKWIAEHHYYDSYGMHMFLVLRMMFVY